MLSKELVFIDPRAIKVDLAKRQRQMDLDCSDLIPSIRARGILLPIIVEEQTLNLCAGWRRLTSALFLELSEVPCRTVPSGTSAFEIQLIEYEENARRKDLTWQDAAKAAFSLHQMCLAERPDWKVEDTARVLSQSDKWTWKQIDVGEYLAEGDKSIAECDTMANALTILTRRRQRQTADAMNSIMSLENPLALAPALTRNSPAPSEDNDSPSSQAADGAANSPAVRGDSLVEPERHVAPPYAIVHADAHKFLSEYAGPKFNFLHCDLPYGVALNEQAGQQGFEGGGYDSSPDIYWQLIDTLLKHWDKFMFPSAHVMFWISMNFYTETIARFEKAAASKDCPVPSDLRINPTPLIWMKTDNKGIISDALRRPRNIYEAALIMSTGDRHIVRPVSNAYGCPTAKGEGSIHTNEKPEPMLKHFFSMFCDQRSRVLDPTCGSGSSIRAAEALGSEAALGLEFNPEFADRSAKKLIQARALNNLSSAVASAEKLDTAKNA